MSADIETKTLNLDGLRSLKADMDSKGYDAMIRLYSKGIDALCYRSKLTGRLTYLSGSVALFIRHDDYREGR